MYTYSTGYITIATIKTEFEDFKYEGITSNTVNILASAPVAINLFDNNKNLLSYSDANKPFRVTFPIKVIILFSKILWCFTT